MHWLGPEEKLKDLLPKKGQFNASSFDALKAEPTVPRSFSEHFLVMAGISRNCANLNVRPVMVYHGKPMGLFDRVKLSTGNGVVETTEAVSGNKSPILEEAASYIVAPVDTVLTNPGKRKSDVAPMTWAVHLIERRLSPVSLPIRPVLLQVTLPFLLARLRVDRERAVVCRSLPAVARPLRPLQDVEVNPSDPFVPDWKLTNCTFLDTPNLCREFMMSVRPPAEESQDMSLSHRRLSNEGCSAAINAFFSFIEIHQRYTKGVFENRDLKKKLAELQGKYTTLESNVMSLQSDKEQSTQLVKDMEIKNRHVQAVMQDGLNKKVKVIENMIKDRESDQARISVPESNVARLQDERHWLISTGMRNSFEKVRNSDEFLDMLAAMSTWGNEPVNVNEPTMCHQTLQTGEPMTPMM
ncbi:hypothetical protein E3N88_28759 [Mikania micrantha]|uniref:Uncharacterized protein n=1 Tax=Mikania micrantha TaxID=192012 RepID=A0A5N6N0P6_9ASTR|nr:hypothetical protein E3N88_28759 [Mikania micrantha]